ncbi:CRIB domain-containing protein RIC4-like isoform X1 [Olea europaea var. sylvestris]|uniref:CRIB domain-containing protein RIC4-like isoform X1 n=1 Tax=Olea europaea var. sylvestris TaxID=158386 RepID=UPI000C1D1AA0|nr:CRIB domain-containing protein RIC4-like isoform X1 [Olea europaea var. sylvestris]
MTDRMEKLALIPFSLSCNSDLSVAVGTTQLPEKKYAEQTTDTSLVVTGQKEGEGKPSREKSMKKSRGFLALPKPLLSKGIHRLVKHLKSFSQMFVYKEEMEEKEKELEIGFPTDVEHVSHIGLDGSTTINPIPEWKNRKAPEILSFPSISLEQFERAMAAQSHGHLNITTDTKFTLNNNLNLQF